MRIYLLNKIFRILLIFILFISILNAGEVELEKKNDSSLLSLLPEVRSWKLTEAPQNYFPETLFEYINGAAEIYLAYEFNELIVGQYQKGNQGASLSIEIYDMGDKKNSFGIYSAERFPGSKFISLGTQGYLEDEALNFIIGKFYIKLLCFDCGEESEDFLTLFSQEIVGKVKDKGGLPTILELFPEEGLVQNSEKFILRNFMGYSFFHNGYIANYRLEEIEFDCFFVEGEKAEDVLNMLGKYLAAKNKENVKEIPKGYRIKDRYYQNIYLARVENYLCGVLKIKDGFEEVGEKYLEMLIKSLKE